jgi:Ser-tRNA(Ala) deacylase AlaX
MKRLYLSDSYAQKLSTSLVDVRLKGTEIWISPDQLLFHPEGGGQPIDKGWIICGDFKLDIKGIVREKGVLFLRVSPNSEQQNLMAKLQDEWEVSCELDWSYRYTAMRHHSAAHVAMACLKQAVPGYGPKGMKIKDDLADVSLRFEGMPASGIGWLKNVEEVANGMIARGALVTSEDVSSLEDAQKKRPEYFRVDANLNLKAPIRMLWIEGIDYNPCGGTHVNDIKEIGRISICDYNASHDDGSHHEVRIQLHN